MRQERLDLTVSLTARYRNLRSILIVVVYGSRGGLEAVAAAIDRSPSELSKMLNEAADDHRKLDVEDFCKILAATGDARPVEWLVEKYMSDPAALQASAVTQLAQFMPAIAELLAQAGVSLQKTKK